MNRRCLHCVKVKKMFVYYGCNNPSRACLWNALVDDEYYLLSSIDPPEGMCGGIIFLRIYTWALGCRRILIPEVRWTGQCSLIEIPGWCSFGGSAVSIWFYRILRPTSLVYEAVKVKTCIDTLYNTEQIITIVFFTQALKASERCKAPMTRRLQVYHLFSSIKKNCLILRLLEPCRRG